MKSALTYTFTIASTILILKCPWIFSFLSTWAGLGLLFVAFLKHIVDDEKWEFKEIVTGAVLGPILILVLFIEDARENIMFAFNKKNINYNPLLLKMKNNFLAGIAGGVVGALIVSHFWPAFWVAWLAAAAHWGYKLYKYKEDEIEISIWTYIIGCCFVWPIIALCSYLDEYKLDFKFQSPIKIKKQEPATPAPTFPKSYQYNHFTGEEKEN